MNMKILVSNVASRERKIKIDKQSVPVDINKYLIQPRKNVSNNKFVW